MKNFETDHGWTFHNSTKNPNGIFLTRSPVYDDSLHPYPYKFYKTKKKIPLTLDKSIEPKPTLKVISEKIKANNLIQIPDEK